MTEYELTLHDYLHPDDEKAKSRNEKAEGVSSLRLCNTAPWFCFKYTHDRKTYSQFQNV